MRILFVAPLDSIHTQRWITYFADKGYEVNVLGIDNASDVKLNNVNTYAISLTGIRIPLLKYFTRYKDLLRQITKIINDLNPDIIHAHWVDLYAYAIIKADFHPFIVTPWGSDILVFPKKSLKMRYIVKYVIKKADVLTCDADHFKKEIIQLGAKPGKVQIIYFGTDLTKFNPGKKDRNIKTELGFDNNARLIISLRALKPIYNVSTLIKAIPLVLEHIKEARFIIVGSGEEEEYLTNLVRELNVGEYVRFTGRLSDEDMQRYTASADIYVSTSLSDAGLSASTAEAMACGVPVVITDFGDNRLWTENEKSGLLFPLEDYKTLAEKIISLLKNPGHAKKMSESGINVIEHKNNWHIEMEKIDTIYQSYCKV